MLVQPAAATVQAKPAAAKKAAPAAKASTAKKTTTAKKTPVKKGAVAAAVGADLARCSLQQRAIGDQFDAATISAVDADRSGL